MSRTTSPQQPQTASRPAPEYSSVQGVQEPPENDSPGQERTAAARSHSKSWESTSKEEASKTHDAEGESESFQLEDDLIEAEKSRRIPNAA